ncbi:hypothetical protein SDC9_91568 [bioreactor metagenome]|uniref:Uncharacterized protein n=1 Tax=bioreactor metagenome TaxID=1076179 RepID=A0A644ZW03_9ZZZZ
MQTFHRESGRAELLGQLVHHGFGIGEDDGAAGLIIMEQQCQSLGLLPRRDLHIDLPDVFQRNLLPVNLNPNRIALKLLGNSQNFLRDGGGEQNDLPLFRHILQNDLDILPEAHVQHFVGLVQNHQFQMTQIQGAPAHMIHNTAGGADDQVGRLQFPELFPIVCTSKNISDLDIGEEMGQLADFLTTLVRQFPGGGKHQNLYVPDISQDALHSGDTEGHCLAGTRLGAGQDIRAGADQRDGLRLNICGFRKAHLCHRFQQFRRKSELGKSLVCHDYPRFNELNILPSDSLFLFRSKEAPPHKIDHNTHE